MGSAADAFGELDARDRAVYETLRVEHEAFGAVVGHVGREGHEVAVVF
jgi:hypothetical protein